MRKFESSQKDECRAQSADSSKAYRKRRAFNCYLSSLRSSLICLAWEKYKLAQVLSSNLISELRY